MKNFKCEICNKEHELFYGIESGGPTVFENIEATEYQSRVKEIRKDTFLLDEDRVFIKGSLDIGIIDSEYVVSFSIYCSSKKTDYLTAISKYTKGVKSELSVRLENEIPFYSYTVNLEAKIVLDPEYDYFKLSVIEESILKSDQLNFISFKQLIRFHENYYHKVDELAAQSLYTIEEFEEIALLLLSDNSTFFADVMVKDNKRVHFQILCNEYLDGDFEPGVGLLLANDNSNEDYGSVKLIMDKVSRRLDFIKGFEDDVDAYHKYYGKDFNSLDKDILSLINLLVNPEVNEYFLSIEIG